MYACYNLLIIFFHVIIIFLLTSLRDKFMNIPIYTFDPILRFCSDPDFAYNLDNIRFFCLLVLLRRDCCIEIGNN